MIILIASKVTVMTITITILIMLSNWPRAGHQDTRMSEGSAW